MRTFFSYLAMVALVILFYKFNIFSLFAHKGAWIIATILIIAVFVAAVRILGNPLEGKDNNDEDNK